MNFFVIALTATSLAQVAPYECRFATDRIVIDGRADEAAWKLAQPVNDFAMPWVRKGSQKPPTATRAKLLWNNENLYFFAQMDDVDLFADITEHDANTFLNDVFELFFKSADDKPAYYEFEVNAANTTFDLYVPRREMLGDEHLRSADEFDFKTAVHLDGTLNKRTDKDTGWSVEGRLAWKDFAHTGGRPKQDDVWKFALCRYDYTLSKSEVLSTSAPLKTNAGPTFHFYEDYAPIRFVK